MRFTKGLLSSLVVMAPVAALAQPLEVPEPVESAPVEPAPPAPVEPPPPAPVADPAPDTHTPESTAAPTPTGQLPPATSDADPAPPVPTPVVPGVTGDVIEQAGVGGSVGYGRAGVLELGGAAGLTMAQDIRALNVAPSIGWFLVDNFEISAILDVTNLKADGRSATLFSALLEPSFHLPINRSLFAFLGMGVGAAYTSDLGAGLAVAPRIGLDVLVGRSGILRPSLSYEYTTHEAMGTIDPEGTSSVTLVAVSSTLRFNLGYSVMW